MILVISKEKKRARAVCQILHHMGILSFAATPISALSEISPMYRAVLLINPSLFPDPADYISRIRSYMSDVPLFSINDGEVDSGISEFFLKNYNRISFAPKIAVDIMITERDNKIDTVGVYRLAGIDASVYESTVRWFNKVIPFTYTEAMILRYLIRSYPNPVSAKEILLHSFNPAKMPEPSCVRTHLSSMNKKFRAISNLSLTALIPGCGYLIKTPEISKNLISV